MNNLYIKPKEVAKKLKIDVKIIYKWIEENRFDYITIKKHFYILKSSLLEFLKPLYT